MEELIKQLKMHLEDENKSYDEYMELAKHAESVDKHEIAQMLRDMSDEEHLHKKHLEFMLEHLGAGTEMNQ